MTRLGALESMFATIWMLTARPALSATPVLRAADARPHRVAHVVRGS
jgi:hypothetical protein